MLCYLMGHMKQLIVLFSVAALSFALQAGDGACAKDKGSCCKAKAAACEKGKTCVCEKGKKCACGKDCKCSCCAEKKAKKEAK